VDTEQTAVGRRERKRLATRQELSRTALRLAVERGPEHVRVDDIAAEADVALRTFHNHFSNKEEAIVSLGVERAARIATDLRDRPANESLADALSQSYAQQYAFDGEVDEGWMARIRLIVSSPALLGEYLKSLVSVEHALAEAIAERTGTDADRDLYPRVLAAAVSGAARVAVAHWLDHGPPTALPAVLRTAIHHVVAASPPPSQR
jgi:AcrR family transcriptional regulator